MKRALLITAALGLSATGAYAECASHVNASVDKDLTVASVAGENKSMSTSETTKAEAPSSATTVTTPEQAD